MGRRIAPSWAHSGRLVILYLVAVTIRLVVLRVLGPAYGGDSGGYRAAADAIRVAPYSGSALGLPPVYPIFLAVFSSDQAALVSQILLDATLAPLFGFVTWRIYGERAGLVAGVWVAIHPSFVFWSRYLLSDTLGVALFGLALARAALSRPGENPRVRILDGALAALTFLCRPILAFASVVVAFASIGRRRLLSTLIPVTLGAAALWLVLAGPYVASTHALPPYDSRIWTSLWNGTRWTEVGRGTGGVDLIYPPGFESLSPEQQHDYFKESFIDFVRARPGEYALSYVRRLLWFWAPAYPEWSLVHKLFAGLYFSTLFALALFGTAKTWFSRQTRVFVFASLGVMMGSLLTVVDYDARYRVPAELCLIPLAAVGSVELGRSVVGRLMGSRRGSSEKTPQH